MVKHTLPVAALLLAASVTAACVSRWSPTDVRLPVWGSSNRIALASTNSSDTSWSGADRESARPAALAEVAGAADAGPPQTEAPGAAAGFAVASGPIGDFSAPKAIGAAIATAEAPASEGVTAGSGRMPIPFRTQKDGERFQGSNCGPAVLGMVLDAFGTARGNADLRFLTHTYQGTVGARTGTALQHMAHVAADLGLEPIGLYQRPDGQYQKDGFARWTVEGVRAEVLAGRPVIPLVKFRLLPGHEDSPFRADHYVVIYGMEGDSFLYHDPIYESPWEGAARWMTADQLAAAMKPTLVPQQAVSFGSGTRAALQTS